MESTSLTPKEYFKAIRVVHTALLLGQIIFALICLTLNRNGELGHNEMINKILIIASPALVIMGIVSGIFIAKAKLNTIKLKSNLAEKLAGYRGVLIIRWALMEMPALFAVICYMLTANLIYLGLAGVIVILFAINRPSNDKLYTELELDQNEQMRMESEELVT